MRGINMVFFQGGPQLGELEAGLVAQWIGPRASVVTGGLGCLVAAGVIAARTPALRKYNRTFIDVAERARLRSVVR
jgi:GTP-sensing pleiotropic transcriptional regulator CodY